VIVFFLPQNSSYVAAAFACGHRSLAPSRRAQTRGALYVGYKVPVPDFRLFAVAFVTSSPDDEAHRRVIFGPIPRIDAVEPSEDSLLDGPSFREPQVASGERAFRFPAQ